MTSAGRSRAHAQGNCVTGVTQFSPRLRQNFVAIRFCSHARFTLGCERLGMQSTSPDLLAAGPLVLNLKTRVLTGPATSTELASSCFGTVRAFMRYAGQIVDTGTLIGELFLAGLEPKEAEVALRHRIMRVRQMLTKVGMPASCLRNVRGEGYVLDAPERVVRTFTPEQAEALDRLVATHPDQAAAAMITTSAGGA